jgi:hypothetical protein
MEFGVLVIAVNEYPDPPGPLPSSESAERLSDIVSGEHGGVVIGSIVATSQDDVTTAFEEWIARHEQAPRSTIVYLVGHGTDDGLDHSFLLPHGPGTRELRTATLASFFEKDWVRRQRDEGAWTLFVLDCCGADIGVTNLQNALTRVALKKPRRLSLWPTAPSGATHSGRFVAAFARALDTFTENDAVIPLNELFRRMHAELGDLEPQGYLPHDAALRNPLRTPTPVVMNLDAHAELRRMIAGLPDDVRNHFLAKAQGAEAGDLTWYFSGRKQEIETLSTWLRETPAGMRVVTGEAGSGKSALLGHLFVLADDQLANAYAATGLAPDLAVGMRPPSNCFDAAIHLTGRTLAQTVADLREQLNAPEDFIEEFQRTKRRVTVLADALDEAQEPVRIADFLKRAVDSNVARVIVGTRRSLGEGPDQRPDPNRHELLDALRANPEDLVIVGRDGEATREYVTRRLSAAGSPYAGDDATIAALANKVASANQPFLFARLLTLELLVRPSIEPGELPVDQLLAESHRGVFQLALNRLINEDREIVAMLAALAAGRGRGIPESGGTWLAVARSLKFTETVSDTAVRKTLERAAPYIMLDAEGGQSVYRLAHRTFVEAFDVRPGVAFERRNIAAALRALVENTGGWEIANHYLVRYLPEHFTSDPERRWADTDGLTALATNAEWLLRAVDLLGVDGVMDALESARRSIDVPIVETIERALRRSRIALSRNATQLSGQLHARLHTEDDPRLSGLGDALARQSNRPWLRMRHGTLDWKADLETTYTDVGKVRALAFGQIDGEPVLGIGIDDSIRLWDPSKGQGNQRVLPNDGRRVTALALSHLDGRPVIVVASGYDNVAVVRDARTGAIIGPSFAVPPTVVSIALGRLGDRLAVAASGDGSLFVWDARTGAAVTDLPPAAVAKEDGVHGVGVFDGQLVAYVARRGLLLLTMSVVDIRTGATVWSDKVVFAAPPTAVGGGPSRDGFIVAAAVPSTTFVSRTDAIRTWVATKADKEFAAVQAQNVRAMTVGEVHGRPMVAYAPDYDSTALVSLSVLTPESKHDPAAISKPAQQAVPNRIRSVFAADQRIVLLTESPLAAAALAGEEPAPVELNQQSVSFALTGVPTSQADFVVEGANGVPMLVQTPILSRLKGFARRRLRLDEPREWPQSSACYGIVDGRAVIATGSLDGCVWIWDAATRAVVAGPLREVSEERRLGGWEYTPYTKHGGPTMVTSLALGRHPQHGDVAAVAQDGAVRLVTVPAGKAIPTPAEKATVVQAVALGRLLGEETLVTGSEGGVVVVWGLASNTRIAALTIDSRVEHVWVVHGIDAIAVQTTAKGERSLLVLDLVAN